MPFVCKQCHVTFSTPIRLRRHQAACTADDAIQLALSQVHQTTDHSSNCVVSADLGGCNTDETAHRLMNVSRRLGIVPSDPNQDTQSIMARLQAAGQAAAAAVVPMLLLIRWSADPAFVARLRKAQSVAVAAGMDILSSRAAMEAESRSLAGEVFELARSHLQTEQGVIELTQTGVFCPEEAGGPVLREHLIKQIDRAEDLLGTRVFKEALRQETFTQRAALMKPAGLLHTAAAARLFEERGDTIVSELRNVGFSIIDDVLDPATCSVLLNHFSQMFAEGKLGDANRDWRGEFGRVQEVD